MKTRADRELTDRVLTDRVLTDRVLSRLMRELTERRRTLWLWDLPSELVAKIESGVVLLGNIEVLLDVSLQKHPLRFAADKAAAREFVQT